MARYTKLCGLVGIGIALVLIAVQLFRPAGKAPADIVAMANPIAPSGAAVAEARRIYDEWCRGCHGPEGRGDGPMAGTIHDRPADLSDSVMLGDMTDGEIYWAVTKGVRPAMPGFESRLSGEERWKLVYLLRRLSGTKPNATPRGAGD